MKSSSIKFLNFSVYALKVLKFLLCFISTKERIMTVSHVKKMCEILAAINSVWALLNLISCILIKVYFTLTFL